VRLAVIVTAARALHESLASDNPEYQDETSTSMQLISLEIHENKAAERLELLLNTARLLSSPNSQPNFEKSVLQYQNILRDLHCFAPCTVLNLWTIFTIFSLQAIYPGKFLTQNSPWLPP
jgi:hypothetical protein